MIRRIPLAREELSAKIIVISKTHLRYGFPELVKKSPICGYKGPSLNGFLMSVPEYLEGAITIAGLLIALITS